MGIGLVIFGEEGDECGDGKHHETKENDHFHVYCVSPAFDSVFLFARFSFYKRWLNRKIQGQIGFHTSIRRGRELSASHHFTQRVLMGLKYLLSTSISNSGRTRKAVYKGREDGLRSCCSFMIGAALSIRAWTVLILNIVCYEMITTENMMRTLSKLFHFSNGSKLCSMTRFMLIGTQLKKSLFCNKLHQNSGRPRL
jgi:hypothetical protein